jgi:hypothetical protein
VGTFIAAPGAPQWASRKWNVIAIPIRDRVGMLDFEPDPEKAADLVCEARTLTKRKLEALMLERAAKARS